MLRLGVAALIFGAQEKKIRTERLAERTRHLAKEDAMRRELVALARSKNKAESAAAQQNIFTEARRMCAEAGLCDIPREMAVCIVEQLLDLRGIYAAELHSTVRNFQAGGPSGWCAPPEPPSEIP